MQQRSIAPGLSAPAHDIHTAVGPTVAAYPSNVGVHQLFELQVERTPDALAVRAGGDSLTYRDLNSRANQLARHLVSQHVGPGSVVAVLMDRSLSLLVSVLATLKAGAAYVPLDPSLPAKRVDYILADSGTTCILIDQDSKCRLRELSDGSPLAVDVSEQSICQLETGNLDHTVDSYALAYYIYTSGSTGVPKGVMVHHRALVNYVCWAKNQYVAPDVESFALYSSVSFDLTVTSIFVPLISGRRIEVYSGREDGLQVLNRVLEDNKVDFLKLTPAHLMLLRDTDLSQSRLKVLVFGGEDLKADMAAEIYAKLEGRAVLYNEYGPTEAVVGCMIHRYDPAADVRGSVPIGTGIDNMRIYLLDERLSPVRPGDVGEIYIGGEGVALGYTGMQANTAECFIPNPFVANDRLYASGDLGRLNEDGVLVFLGRKDLQIKLRGYRIEPGEIESVLRTYPGIEECVLHWAKEGTRTAADQLTYCIKCGLASNFPNTTYSVAGVCSHCQAYDRCRNVIEEYFSSMDELRLVVGTMKAASHPKYDCVVALSGGKDSVYAIGRMVDLGARVLAFTLDNGYISVQAKQNIDRVVCRLGVDHRYLSTPFIKEILVDSLKRHSNVCNGCFKTIYTFAINLAQEVGVNYVVMGLSRGQLLETRLSALFRTPTFDDDAFAKSLVDARKIYHRVDDAVSRLLDTTWVKNDEVIENIQFIDFFRYCDATRQDVYDYVATRFDWRRPTDTGRSTNCLLNDVGIYFHNKERGYHNYSLPYSWDVRLGHITREVARRELDDEAEIDIARLGALVKDLGYEAEPTRPPEAELVAYYVAAQEVSPSDLRRFLSDKLPDYMVPRWFVLLDHIPITPNGKINRQALPRPDVLGNTGRDGSAPRTRVQEQLAELWKEVLAIDQVGLHDNFFELGGHSLPALMLLYKIASQFQKTISIQEFSEAPTISALAMHIGGGAEALPTDIKAHRLDRRA